MSSEGANLFSGSLLGREVEVERPPGTARLKQPPQLGWRGRRRPRPPPAPEHDPRGQPGAHPPQRHPPPHPRGLIWLVALAPPRAAPPRGGPGARPPRRAGLRPATLRSPGRRPPPASKTRTHSTPAASADG